MIRKKPGKQTVDPNRILRLLQGKPRSPRYLLRELEMSHHQRADLMRVLQTLVLDGKVNHMRGGEFGVPKNQTTLIGRFVQRQPGFAFFIPANEAEPDLYIPQRGFKDAMPDDEVEIKVVTVLRKDQDSKYKRQAEVVRVIKRARTQLVGRFLQNGSKQLIRPDGMSGLYDFIVPRKKENGAKPGDKVVATVTTWPSLEWQGVAEVDEVLGASQDPGVEITALIRRYQIPVAFSAESLAEAKAIAKEPTPAEFGKRRDLREQRIVTIDGADARDFDDAVSCETRPEGGWRLGVHIADVSYYLRNNTRLDLEARERGTSVYLPDRVIHMLPEPLSCGVCSLVPDKDRYTVTALMDIETNGRISHAEFFRSVIHSHGRLTYDWVQEVLTQPKTDNPATPFTQELKCLNQISLALRAKRVARGSLDFDLPDPRVVMGQDGKVLTIEKRMQLESHRLIEDCMIAANEAVAEYLQRQDMPSLYRVHDIPSGEKLEEFKEFLEAYGYTLDIGKPKEASKAFQRLIKEWEGKPEAQLLNMTLLRAMKLAVYTPKNIGHFGLASACYSHFTSPIRRYPDLIVHRMLNERLEKGAPTGERRNELQGKMVEWGEHLSTTERRAEKAEREAIRMKQMEFIAGRIGQCFAGSISTVANYGFFVELEEHFVEGLVLTADLKDDYYTFDDHRRFLQGANTGRMFITGQKVQVRVERLDKEELRAIFSLQTEAPYVKPESKRNKPHVISRRPGRKRL